MCRHNVVFAVCGACVIGGTTMAPSADHLSNAPAIVAVRHEDSHEHSHTDRVAQLVDILKNVSSARTNSGALEDGGDFVGYQNALVAARARRSSHIVSQPIGYDGY
jgi:hypothetical protein